MATIPSCNNGNSRLPATFFLHHCMQTGVCALCFLSFIKHCDMQFIMRIIVTSIVAFGLSYLLSGVHIDSFWTAIVFSIVLAILNAIVKPILILLTLPLTILTLGLFLFVINALIILLASRLIDGFRIDGFWWALLFSLLLSFITSLLYGSGRKKD